MSRKISRARSACDVGKKGHIARSSKNCADRRDRSKGDSIGFVGWLELVTQDTEPQTGDVYSIVLSGV